MRRRRCGRAAPRSNSSSCVIARTRAGRIAVCRRGGGCDLPRAATERSRRPGSGAVRCWRLRPFWLGACERCSRAPRRGRRARRQGLPASADRTARARARGDRRRALPAHIRARRRARPQQRADAARSRTARACARPARRRRRRAARERARTRRARAPRARAARAHGAGTRPLQVGATTGARPRSGGMRCLGGPPAARSDRHARRLVGAQAVVRLSVSQGVAVHARPRFTEVSIAARVRR